MSILTDDKINELWYSNTHCEYPREYQMKAIHAVADAAVQAERTTAAHWQSLYEAQVNLNEAIRHLEIRREAALQASREGQEPVAWALIWEADGERQVRLYDDETHCVFDAESVGGVCRPLVFAGTTATTPPAAPVPDLYAVATMVLEWWEDAQYMTTASCGGDSDSCYEYNVFNREPNFVVAARAAIAKVKGEKV